MLDKGKNRNLIGAAVLFLVYIAVNICVLIHPHIHRSA